MKTTVNLFVLMFAITAGYIYADDDSRRAIVVANAQSPEVVFHTDSFFDGTLVQARGRSISKDQVEAKRRFMTCQSLWAQHGRRILRAMSDVLGVAFSDNRLHVVLSEEFSGAYSMPLTVSIWYEESDFVAMLTHEIAHWLLTNNTGNIDVGSIWYEMFPNELRLTRNHILVFAVMEHVFTDVLGKPKMLAFEKKAGGSYGRAWKIVQERGHLAIIEEFRQHYAPQSVLISAASGEDYLVY